MNRCSNKQMLETVRELCHEYNSAKLGRNFFLISPPPKFSATGGIWGEMRREPSSVRSAAKGKSGDDSHCSIPRCRGKQSSTDVPPRPFFYMI